MKVNPDILKGKHLRIWYDAGGRLNNNQITTVRPALEGKRKLVSFIRNLFWNFSSMENHRTNRKGKTWYTKSTRLCHG